MVVRGDISQGETQNKQKQSCAYIYHTLCPYMETRTHIEMDTRRLVTTTWRYDVPEIIAINNITFYATDTIIYY